MRALVLGFLLVGVGCDGDVENPGGGGAGGAGSGGTGGEGGQGGQPIVTELFPGAPPLPGETECKVTITENLPNYGAKHHPICTPLAYQTNPPSSGDHWGMWAMFKSYTLPVPREMLVHNLEHGAIVMAYGCPGGCPDVPIAFEDVAADFGADPLCVASPTGAERSRIIITPDPELAEPIGLSAWRATYVATCIDPDSMLAFVTKHYAKAPENICAEGKDPTDPVNGVTVCMGI
jgi:hypothetical protein